MSEISTKINTPLTNASKNQLTTFLHFFYALTGAAVLTLFFWDEYGGMIHSIMELICILTAYASFIFVWIRYKHSSTRNQLVGFGFLIMAAADSFHTYFYPVLQLYPENYIDLSARFWVMGRFTEALILFIVTLNFKDFKLGRRYGLVFSVFFSFILTGLFIFQKNLFPVFLTDQGLTHSKMFMECIVIIILLISLWNLRKKLNSKDIFDYQYVFKSIIFYILSTVCFITFSSLNSFLFVLGHTLRIVNYYYLFKGIIETEINRPYLDLEENNKRLANILDAIPIAIHTYNNKLRFDFANKKFEELTSLNREDLLGATSEELLRALHRVDALQEPSLVDSLIQNKQKEIPNLIRTYQLNGENTKLLVKAHNIEDGALVIFEDVKKSQEIDNLHLQTQTIMNSISVPAIIADIEGTITMCNKAFSDLMEIEIHLLKGAKISSFSQYTHLKKEDLDHLVELASVEGGEFNTTIKTAGNKMIEVTIITSVIQNINNENIGIMCILNDITSYKAHQRKLINQEKLALLGQMGASIVHETRNFLTTILGSSQFILQNTTNRKIMEYAEQIKADINEVNRIISDFLTMSKPREAVKDEVAINDLISSLRKTIETSSLIKGVNVDFHLQNIERYISCDETMIRQVILNLCKNAVEAMEHVPSPLLKICTEFNEAANKISIEITDNGKGMSEDILSKMGTAFFTTKENGTGLGIFSCYQIIQEHNGNIKAVSIPGKGTTFSIILPCIDEEDEEDEDNFDILSV